MPNNQNDRTELLLSQIRSLGGRALSTAHCISASVRLAPTTTLKRALLEYAREELERFHGAELLYQSHVDGGDLLQDIGERLAEIPAPGTWLEVVVMQFLFDRAGRVVLGELARSSDKGLAQLAQEQGRVHAAMADESGNALRNTLTNADELIPIAQHHFDRWLALSLRSFGRPNTERGQRAIELGLKPRNSSELIAEYIESLRAMTRSCGLTFPTAASLKLELPAGVLP